MFRSHGVQYTSRTLRSLLWLHPGHAVHSRNLSGCFAHDTAQLAPTKRNGASVSSASGRGSALLVPALISLPQVHLVDKESQWLILALSWLACLPFLGPAYAVSFYASIQLISKVLAHT